jgi:hypothetical protein
MGIVLAGFTGIVAASLAVMSLMKANRPAPLRVTAKKR